MRSKFKKVLAAVSAIAVSCTTMIGIPQSAFAADTPDYLALGDSISTGYGLASPETEGFVYLLADAIGYELTNNAVDGNTAAGIAAQISGGAMDAAIADAELITITCGGNDMMGLLYQRIADAYNAVDTNTTKITAADVSSALAGTHASLTQSSLLTYATTALTGFADTEEFNAGLTAFSASLTSVMNYINQINPDAEVVVNTQYNPYKSFSSSFLYKSVYSNMEAGSIALNEVITAKAETLDYTVADVYTAFSTSTDNLCNADASNMFSPNLDFHPNAAGHALIADTVYAVVDGSIPCGHTLENGICTICGMVSIDETVFPDEIFRTYVSDNFDTNADDMLDADEIAAVTEISITYTDLSDLTGVEHFTALTDLYCNNNELTSFDISKNTALTELTCYSNHMTSIDVSGCTALTFLDCGYNDLEKLNVSKNTELNTLYCDFNQLTSLDVSQNTKLTELHCESNPLWKFDLSANYSGTLTFDAENTIPVPGRTLDLSAFGLDAANVSGGTLDENGILTPDTIPGTVTYVTELANGMAMTVYAAFGIAINEENFPDANFRTYVDDNFDTDDDDVLHPDELAAVKNINVTDKGITDLTGVEYFTALTYLNCYLNQLTRLDVSKNTALIELDCSSNPLTSLDVSKNSALEWLHCNNNQLTSLDVSKNTALTRLYCHDNQLTSLDVSKNAALLRLHCYSNELTSLDVSKNTALTFLDCSNNRYDIDLADGTFDLSALPEGFEIDKARDWTNAAVDGNTLTVSNPTMAVTYTYDLGNGRTEIFTLNPVSCTLTEDMASEIADQVYTGEEIEPVEIICGEYTLVEGEDYTVSYENNVNVGTATATITGMGMFNGEFTVKFEIEKAAPEVTPIIPEGEYTEGDALPEIGYESKISGIIEWLTELVNGLIEGENELEWQFTPEDMDNYEIVTGTEIVEAQATTTTTTTTTTTSTTTTTTTTTTQPTTTSTTTTTTEQTTTSAATTTTEQTTTSTTTTTEQTTTSAATTTQQTTTSAATTTQQTTTSVTTTTEQTTTSTTTTTEQSTTSTTTTTQQTTTSATTTTTEQTTTSTTTTTQQTTTSAATTTTEQSTTSAATTTQQTTTSTTTTTEQTTTSTATTTTEQTTTSTTTTTEQSTTSTTTTTEQPTTSTTTTTQQTTTSTTTTTEQSTTSTTTTTEQTTTSTTTTTQQTTTSTTTTTEQTTTSAATTTEQTTTSAATTTTQQTTTSTTTTAEQTTTSTTTTTDQTTTSTTTTTEQSTTSTTTTTTEQTTTSTTTTTTEQTTTSTTTTTEQSTTSAATTTTEQTTTSTTTTTEQTTTSTTTTTSDTTTSATTTTDSGSDTTTSTTTTMDDSESETTTSATTATDDGESETTTATTTATDDGESETTTSATTATDDGESETTTSTTTTTDDGESDTTTSATTTTDDGESETTTSTTTTTDDGESETTTSTTTTTPTHIASDEELCDWAVKDYEKKTGVTPEHAEIEYTADGNAVITLTDAEGSVLDVYNVDPFTGVGTESDGGEVNLPQTGYSVVYNYIMLAAAAMVLFGIFAMAKSRKRDEE